MIALNTYTGTDFNDTFGTDWPMGCSGNCKYCTMTCTVIIITDHHPVATSTFPEWPEMPEPKECEREFIEPVDLKLVKLRRKQKFQKRFYKTKIYIKPQLNRKSMVSISGWLTKSEYKKKKGHGIK